MRWDAPAHMLLDVGITPTGRAREDGVWIYGTDILTPKDAGSTYYFWGVSASNGNDGPHVGALWTQAIEAAFGGQDKPMIEAQHALIRQRGGNDMEDVDSVFLQSDAGPERCRRELRKLIESDDRAGVPQPRNPDLQKLLAESRRADKVVPVV
jgi:vanillate O-demethylase monooxygenase subunit